jgi:hypothetical protein
MKKVFLSVFLAGAIVLIAGCLAEDWDAVLFRRKPPQEPEYLDYLERVRSQPLDFQILASDDAMAWSRAQYISKKYGRTLGGGRKLLTSSNDIIEIAPWKHNIPYYQETGYLFRIVRAPRGDMTDYVVSYSSPSPDHPGFESLSQENRACAGIIAYYIVSGRLYKRAMDYPELARLK